MLNICLLSTVYGKDENKEKETEMVYFEKINQARLGKANIPRNF